MYHWKTARQGGLGGPNGLRKNDNWGNHHKGKGRSGEESRRNRGPFLKTGIFQQKAAGSHVRWISRGPGDPPEEHKGGKKIRNGMGRPITGFNSTGRGGIAPDSTVIPTKGWGGHPWSQKNVGKHSEGKGRQRTPLRTTQLRAVTGTGGGRGLV